jgi:guanylate kinase
VVISGPSGVGKDAVLADLRETHPELFFAVTATTRPKRPGETDNLDYIFLTPGRFDQLLSLGEFLEHAHVYGNQYGVPKGPLRDAMAAGKDVVVKVDVQGAATIRELAPDAFLS